RQGVRTTNWPQTTPPADGQTHSWQQRCKVLAHRSAVRPGTTLRGRAEDHRQGRLDSVPWGPASNWCSKRPRPLSRLSPTLAASGCAIALERGASTSLLPSRLRLGRGGLMMRFAAVGCNRQLGGRLACGVNLVTFTIELERED